MTATLYAFGAALAWSWANVAIQATGRRVGPRVALFWSALLGLPFLAAVALVLDGTPTAPNDATLWYTLGGGLAALCAYGGLFVALEGGRVTVVAPIIAAWALFAAVIGVAQGESLSQLGWSGVLAVTVGNALLARDSGPAGTRPAGERGAILAALVSALGFACMAPCLERANDGLSGVWGSAAIWAVAACLGLPALARAELRQGAGSIRGHFEPALVLPALFESVGLLCLGLALVTGELIQVAPIASLATGLSVLWGLLFLGEQLGRLAALGAIAASLGVVLIHL